MKFQIFRIEISPFGEEKKFRAIPFIVKRIKALIKLDSSSKISPFKFIKLPINYFFTFKEFPSLYGKECAVYCMEGTKSLGPTQLCLVSWKRSFKFPRCIMVWIVDGYAVAMTTSLACSML